MLAHSVISPFSFFISAPRHAKCEKKALYSHRNVGTHAIELASYYGGRTNRASLHRPNVSQYVYLQVEYSRCNVGPHGSCVRIRLNFRLNFRLKVADARFAYDGFARTHEPCVPTSSECEPVRYTCKWNIRTAM